MNLQQLLDLPRMCVLHVEAHRGNVRMSIQPRGQAARPLLELSPDEADSVARHLWSAVTEIRRGRRMCPPNRTRAG